MAQGRLFCRTQGIFYGPIRFACTEKRERTVHILLIDDETRVADFIRRGLSAEGWSISHAASGEAGVELCASATFDVIVLDLMLPKMSGQEVCQKLRARRNLTPILMLSALDAADERVNGLQLGADDYLAKPFDFDELVARLVALHRRATDWSAGAITTVLDCDGIFFDRRSLLLTVEGAQVDLSHKEREILLLLMLGRGRVFSREHILNAVWGVHEDPLTNVIDVYIGRLRRKLGSHGARLMTVRQVGYRFN
jgi:DNA-binding response OmpR family regulator